MRAFNVPESGAQPVVSDLPVPEVTDGAVLVRVKSAALNAIDKTLVAGMMAEMMPHLYPLVVGRDAAGVVEAVGAGVDHVAVGDEVIGHVLLAPPIQAGSIAEYALIPAAAVAAKPAGLDFDTAAALPLAGTAALASVDAVEASEDQVVLVVGATGGVGSYAVQLLAARGVTVVATGGAADSDRLTGLGAATVVDHRSGTPVADQVTAAYPGGVDALIDLVASSPDALPLSAVRKGGRVASTLGAADGQVLGAAGLTGSNIMASPLREVIEPLAALAAAGTLKVDITKVFPLEQAADGLAALSAGGTRGKIVIRVTD
ncbi:MAG TPA: NADP-dependent oxidoreductase [Streptomyces sp.]|uniref:NADP-dependent oxidoreductase n=1 Tax=Streptomyces sp. TaxID=1931 RepID=UPI002BB5F394|nr:NADP-dependent oxidoreductase [Streptomyces sp.]HWU07652.1 NADP-dependent oxidoreductase [Streptomyces sp.]